MIVLITHNPQEIKQIYSNYIHPSNHLKINKNLPNTSKKNQPLVNCYNYNMLVWVKLK